MATTQTELPEPGLTCPRCTLRPVTEGAQLCGPCQVEENEAVEEAAAGTEDAATAAATRQADARAKADKMRAGTNAPANEPAGAQTGTAKTPPTTTAAPGKTAAKPAGAGAKPATNTPPKTAAQTPAAGKTAPPANAAPAVHTRRMTLDSVKSDSADEAPRLWVYGVEGIGKSTLAADAEAPIFVPGGKSPNIRRHMFPVPENYRDVLEAIATLTNDAHQFKTLVFDDFDYVEGLVWDHAIRAYNDTNPKVRATGIEDVAGGYGRGYQAAVDLFRMMLPRLEKLRAKTNMQVIFVSHCVVKNYKNPTGNDYDRFVNSMNEKAVAAFRRWCDAMLFVNYIDTVKHDWKAKKTFAEGSGKRVLYTQRRPTHDAKNRYDLPFEVTMPIDAPYAPLGALIKASRDPAVLLTRIEEKLELVGDEQIVAWVRSQLAQKIAADKLARINTRLTEIMEEKEEAAMASEQSTDDLP